VKRIVHRIGACKESMGKLQTGSLSSTVARAARPWFWHSHARAARATGVYIAIILMLAGFGCESQHQQVTATTQPAVSSVYDLIGNIELNRNCFGDPATQPAAQQAK